MKTARNILLRGIIIGFLVILYFCIPNSGMAATSYWYNSSILSSLTTDAGPRAIATDGQKIFIANQTAGTISVYDAYTPSTVFYKLATISIGSDPDWITYTN